MLKTGCANIKLFPNTNGTFVQGDKSRKEQTGSGEFPFHFDKIILKWQGGFTKRFD